MDSCADLNLTLLGLDDSDDQTFKEAARESKQRGYAVWIRGNTDNDEYVSPHCQLFSFSTDALDAKSVLVRLSYIKQKQRLCSEVPNDALIFVPIQLKMVTMPLTTHPTVKWPMGYYKVQIEH